MEILDYEIVQVRVTQNILPKQRQGISAYAFIHKVKMQSFPSVQKNDGNFPFWEVCICFWEDLKAQLLKTVNNFVFEEVFIYLENLD